MNVNSSQQQVTLVDQMNLYTCLSISCESLNRVSHSRWYDEIKGWNFNTNKRCEGQITNHFTLMVWKETLLINCGHATTEINNMKKYFVVCQYFVKGNQGNPDNYEIQVGKPTKHGEGCGEVVVADLRLDTENESDSNSQAQNTISASNTDTKTNNEKENEIKTREELKTGCKTEALTEEEKFVLDEHNKLRQQHQDTPDLCYAESGEDITFTAQAWAEELAATGMFQHSKGGEYGENIAYKSTSGDLPDKMAAYNTSTHR